MVKRSFSTRTYPIMNFPCDALHTKYLLWGLPPEAGQRSRQEAQRRLGQQTFCWTGSVRHWVWEGQGPERGMWRLFASTKGLSLELSGCGDPYGEDADLDLAHTLLSDFITKWEAGARYPSPNPPSTQCPTGPKDTP